MRNWLSWVIGFAVTFAGAFLLLLVYSMDQPSLWLPVLLGIAFYGLLGFSPRILPSTRTGLGLLFGSCACLLWMFSAYIPFSGDHGLVQIEFAVLAGLIALVGLAFAIAGRSRQARLLPVLLVMLLGWIISYVSSSHGAAEPMVSWVMRHLHLGRAAADGVVLAVRKTVHFTFYGVVGLAGANSAAKNGADWNLAAIAGLSTTLAFSTFDELRQSGQVGRTGSAWDVLLDMTGAATAVILVLLATRSRRGDASRNAR